MVDPQSLNPTRPSRAEVLAALESSRGEIIALLSRQPEKTRLQSSLHVLSRTPLAWAGGAFCAGVVASWFLFRHPPKSSLAARRPLAKIAIRDLALPLVLTVVRPCLERFAEQRLAPHLER